MHIIPAFLMMGSDHYCLKWNNHWTNLLRVFNSLLQSQTFVDITLACEGRHLKAHRLVLSACSPYFKDLLVSHPDRHPIIILKDVRFKELETLVQFIYNGEVSVQQHELTSLLCTAKELQIKGLADDTFCASVPARRAQAKPFYDSTNISSSDQPTNLTVRRNLDHAPHTNGQPLDLHSKRSCTPTRGVSPDPKKRRVSPVRDPRQSPLQEPESTTCKSSQNPDELRHAVAGPSGLSRSASEEKEVSTTPCDRTTKEGHPRLCVIKQPKEKPPDPYHPCDAQNNELDKPLNLQNPEVILEEESNEMNGTKTPSPSLANSMIGSTTPHSPMSFFQQTFSGMQGYPPSLSLLQSGLLEQQQQKMAASQVMAGPGLLQANSLLNFVDFLKAVGGRPPGPHPQALLANAPGIARPSLSPGVRASSKSPNRDYEMLTCSICARVMPSVHVLEEHVRIHEEEKPYTCEQCGQRYKYQSAFQRHKDQNHTAKLPGEKPYRCDVCGQCFKYHKSFTKHRSNHDLLDSFMKTEPDEGTVKALHDAYFPGLLQRHFSRTPITTIKEEVKETFDSADENSKDIKPNSENGDIKEEDEEIDIDEIVPDVPDEIEEASDYPAGKFLYCCQCKSTFKDHKTFDGHCRLSVGCSSETLKEVSIGDEISLTSIPSPNGISPQGSPGSGTKCPTQGLKVSSAHSLSSAAGINSLYRGLSPSGTHLPNACDPSLMNLSKFFNISGASSSLPVTSRSSEHHASSTIASPEEDRPFKCQYCQKGFKGRENLKLHIRTHTGEKPYNCGVCGKAFGGRSDMNRHLRIHTGEKPYPCKVCGKKFARADYLSKHITTHLGIPFAKPVHSLQQSLQNLENMQSLQSARALAASPQGGHSVQILSSVQNLHQAQTAMNKVSKD